MIKVPDRASDIIKFNTPKKIAGAVFAVLSLLSCCIWFDWAMGILFACVFVVAAGIEFKTDKKYEQLIINVLWLFCLTFITTAVPIMVLGSIFAVYTAFGRIMLNVVCYLIVVGVIFVINADWKKAFIIASLMLFVLATLNGVIYQFRGKEFVPADIFSMKTAINVFGQYRLQIKPGMLYAWLWLAALLFVGSDLPVLSSVPKIRARIIAVLIDIVLVFVLFVGAKDIKIETWDKSGTYENGYYLNFFMALRDAFVEKPGSYSQETIDNLAQKYDGAAAEEEAKPNIIVIMDESYADFRVFNGELKSDVSISPFVDSLEENTVKGYALSSVFGGNTANSEFEFLTAHTLGFLPQNCVPYQQYIRSEIAALPWIMRAKGYKSISTHPYKNTGWSRKVMHPYLGFEETTFDEDYPAEKMVREYISDEEMFDYIMNALEDNSKNGDEPLFLFGISMQNHGGYKYEGEDFNSDVKLVGYEGEYPEAEQYLTLLRKTDSALKTLIDRIKEYPEKTIVMFFGDHFPAVENSFYEELNGGEFDALDEKMLKYKVPFFIWANYDIDEKKVDCTSINYLSGYLMEAADLPPSAYQQFLMELEQKIPAMNAWGFFSVERNGFVAYEDATEEEKKLLDKYQVLQYNNLFDSQNRSEEFFAQYIDG